MLFHLIDGAFCVIQRAGVYKQCELYLRKGEIYAKYAGGYIGLRTHGTTIPKATWDHIEGVEWEKDSLGRLRLKGH